LPTLDAKARARLRDAAFAYVDSDGRRRLPIHDAAHVRNALARFEQVSFEDDGAREKARSKLLRAAKKHGIVPIGFFDGQLRQARTTTSIRARAADMARWPRGTATFLLSDIEGSTKLLRTLGDGYAPVLRDVRSLIRTSVRKAGGHEVDTQGDEYFAVFARPLPALRAAIAIQAALAERAWPDRRTVRARIGIHSGRATLTDTGYVGLAVHTAARICDAGHGGQILVSSATIAAMGTPTTATFRYLGRYRLEGLADPEELSQVVATGLVARFPALRARAARFTPRVSARSPRRV
jgi:class 3 adenylate cyclase